MQSTVKCASCDAMVPSEKAFCPNCHEPMEKEEQRRDNRPIENMAATVVGFSLSQLNQGEAVAPKPPVRAEAKPPAATPAEKPSAITNAPPAALAEAGKNSKFLLIAGVVVFLGLLAIVFLVLVGTQIIRF